MEERSPWKDKEAWIQSSSIGIGLEQWDISIVADVAVVGELNLHLESAHT
jgi:hypothetical protein